MTDDEPGARRVFARGLRHNEVAVVKRMRLRGNPRDYIFSFLMRPGRKLTPACISEIENGRIGLSVEPASERETDQFIARRLNESSPNGEGGPLSAFHVQEALGQYTRAQDDFFRDESQQVEFKLCLKIGKDDILEYAKTMSAFANNSGGHLFFGVSNERRPVGIMRSDCGSFDWDRLSAICREHFQPDMTWDRDLHSWEGRNLGVVYTYAARVKPIMAAPSAPRLMNGSVLYRYRGATEPIRMGDFLSLLAERDAAVRREMRQKT